MGYLKWEIFFTGLVLISTLPFCSGITDSSDGKVKSSYFSYSNAVLFYSVWFLGKTHRKLLPLLNVLLKVKNFN